MKKGLGRGLEALIGESPLQEVQERATANRSPRKLLLGQLVPDEKQARRHFEEQAITELAISLKSHGMLQPIIVRKIGEDRYQIVAGERRYRAAQKAGMHEIPVIVRTYADDEKAYISLIENVQRADLNAIEEARAYAELQQQFRYQLADISGIIGKSRSHIANLLRLLKLPQTIQQALIENKISMGHARALIGCDRAAEICEKIISENLSVRQVENMVRSQNHDKKSDTPKKEHTLPPAAREQLQHSHNVDVLEYARSLADSLGLHVEIYPRGAGGKLVISYEDNAQLTMLGERLLEETTKRRTQF